MPQLWIYLAVMALGAAGGWRVTEWRWQAKEAERAKQELANERQNTATTIRRLENVLAAEAAAVARERWLRDAAARARDAHDGLLTATASALQSAANDHGTCIDRATALSELLAASVASYRSVAEKADRHASDAMTCHEAWPK